MADGLLPPDVRRGTGLPAGRALAQRVGDAAVSLAWRVLQPGERELAAGSGAEPLTRLRYTADDGWTADLFRVNPVPGGHGAPVLLAHGLGASHRLFALEPERCLARTLARAGFAVYLWEHRGDPSAVGHAPFSLDDIAIRDLPAALDAIAGHSGFERVVAVGHGAGGLALYLALALGAGERIAGVATLSAPVHFTPPQSATRAAFAVSALLPASWILPGRASAHALLPFIVSGDALASPMTSGAAARGHLRYATGDLHGGVLRQLARSVHAGHLCDATGRLDVVAALRPLPALVIEPDADPACPIGSARPAADALSARFLPLSGGWGHLDPLLAGAAACEVFPSVVDFAEQARA